MSDPLPWFKSWMFLLILALGLAVIHGPLVLHGGEVGFDDQNVVHPMYSVGSLQDYLYARSVNRVVDIQPVRDFTYVFDNAFAIMFDFNPGHVVNVVLWAFVAIVARALLLEFGVGQGLASVLALFFAFDPIFAGTVAWLSARKHILSSLFILSASLVLVRHTKEESPERISRRACYEIIILYLLACFSQPLPLLWPFFAFLWIYTTNARRLRYIGAWITGLALAFIGSVCAWLNEAYYTTGYLEQTGVQKYVGHVQDTLFWKLMALGRYVFQVVWPFQPTVWDHGPSLAIGWAGLSVAVVGLWLVWKSKSKRAWLAIFYFLLALMPVLFRLTNVFAADSYLINASVPILAVAGLAFQRWNLRLSFRKAITGAVLLLMCGAIIFSREIASAWVSNLTLWQEAYRLQPSGKNAFLLSEQLLLLGRNSAARDYAIRAWATESDRPKLGEVLARATYRDATLDSAAKKEILSKYPCAWSSYYLAGIDASEGRMKDARDKMRELFSRPTIISDAGRDIETMGAEYLYFSQQAEKQMLPQGSKTRPKPTATDLALVVKVRQLKGDWWSEWRFFARANQLGMPSDSFQAVELPTDK